MRLIDAKLPSGQSFLAELRANEGPAGTLRVCVGGLRPGDQVAVAVTFPGLVNPISLRGRVCLTDADGEAAWVELQPEEAEAMDYLVAWVRADERFYGMGVAFDGDARDRQPLGAFLTGVLQSGEY